jgi:molybdopterin converting factor small subunit
MIEIEIRLYATLRRYRPELKVGEPLFMSLEEGTTLKRVLEEVLGIPMEVIKVVLVNGIYRELDYVLEDDDRVGIFPPVAGG